MSSRLRGKVRSNDIVLPASFKPGLYDDQPKTPDKSGRRSIELGACQPSNNDEGTMMNDEPSKSGYYSDTAYDSRKQYDRITSSDNRWMPNRMNGHLLKWGVDFGIYHAAADYSPEKFNKYKRSFDDSNYKQYSPYHRLKDIRQDDGKGNGLNHDHMVVLSRQSWAMAVVLIFFLSRFAFILFPIVVLVDSFFRNDWSAFNDPSVYKVVVGIGLVFFLSWLSLEKEWFKFRVKAIFFRSTGLVHVFPGKAGSVEVCHFTEFDSFINSSAAGSRVGALTYSLVVTHRQNRDLRIPIGADDPIKQSIFMKWEMIQQFMDTSKPLPDVPELEPFRHLDPVTAEWDKVHSRPPHLYENMSDKEFSKYREILVWNYEKGFQWGSDRWVSEAEGWQPPPEKWWLVPVDDAEPSTA